MEKAKLEAHWRDSRMLLCKVLAVWFFLAYFIHFFVGKLNEFSFLGFPLGYWAASQGALLGFVLLIFWFARKQDAIDNLHGVGEDEQGGAQ